MELTNSYKKILVIGYHKFVCKVSASLHRALDGADLHSEVVDGSTEEYEGEQEGSDVGHVDAGAVALSGGERAESNAERDGQEYHRQYSEDGAADTRHARPDR